MYYALFSYFIFSEMAPRSISISYFNILSHVVDLKVLFTYNFNSIIKHKKTVHTRLDVCQGVHQDNHKLANCLQACGTQVQDAVVGIEIEGVAVRIIAQTVVGWDFLRQ